MINDSNAAYVLTEEIIKEIENDNISNKEINLANPDNPAYDLFMEELSDTQNSDKQLVFYNPKDDYIYSYDFGPGEIGINLVDCNLVLANFDETYAEYKRLKK